VTSVIGLHILLNGISGKSRLELLPNIFPVKNLDARNFPVHNIEDEHPLLGCQGYIPMTGAVRTLGFGAGVERGAEVIPAAATVHNSQTGDLGSQFGFALLDEKLPKLGCKRGERVGEVRSFFGSFIHESGLEQLGSI
jgi:hypothetical protein